MREYLYRAVKNINPEIDVFSEEVTFTLQNGADILGRHFPRAAGYDYEDSLYITDTKDLICWIEFSLPENVRTEKNLSDFFDYFEAVRLREGAVAIPKEAGIFVSKKRF